MELKDSKLDEKIKEIKQKKADVEDPDKKKKRRKKTITTIIITLFILAISSLGFLIYKGYIFSKEIGFTFDPKTLINTDKNELKKDSSGRYTNALLVGLDTRETGTLLNTDTIILASYDHKTNNVTLMSIPRDFHVEVSKDVNWYVRINSIYSAAENKKEGEGIEALKETVERVTGQEIQYHAMVDFKAFVEIIDTLGGIDINVENSFTDYMYPDGTGYKTVTFKAGPQTMDGETALVYSRSRHSSQNNEGTDFARARRQQKVIIAIKEKILSSESLSNPRTIMGVISSIADNIKVSEFTIDDIDAGFELAKNFEKENGQIYSFVLDPSSGGSLLVDRKNLESGAYAIGPKLGLGKYEDIIEYMELIREYPDIYSSNPKIIVYDTGLGFKDSKEQTENIKEKLPYLNIIFGGTIFKDKEETILFAREENFNTVSQHLSEIIGIEYDEKPEYITSNTNAEDVTILLGKQIDLESE